MTAPDYDRIRLRHQSLRAALAAGPKYFEELMTATGSDDGREIVLELEALREQGMLERELERGRYRLRPSKN